jgi:histidine ammonia-lyase
MGANAATKCYKILENVERVLAIELLSAAKAMQFRRPLKSSSLIESVISELGEICSLDDKDIILSPELIKAQKFVHSKYF